MLLLILNCTRLCSFFLCCPYRSKYIPIASAPSLESFICCCFIYVTVYFVRKFFVTAHVYYNCSKPLFYLLFARIGAFRCVLC